MAETRLGAGARIAVLFPARDPLDPQNWSGSPRGVADGLAAAGVQVVPIGTAGGRRSVSGAWHRLRRGNDTGAARSAERVAARTDVLRRAVRNAGPLDGLVAMGTDLYRLEDVRTDAPTLTFDDATLAQQWRHPDSDIHAAGFDPRAVTDWCATQGASSRAADACGVSTPWAAASFVDDYGVAADRVHVVGMGHRPRSAPAGARDWSEPRFLFVGIDWRRKNGAAVVDAFRSLRALHPTARLDLVGEHPTLDEPGVVGHGLLRRDDAAAQAELDDLFRRATAFVLPSRFDPSPIAYLEAASAGLPVIATTEGGAGLLLGDAAISVGPDDADALLDAMVRLAEPETARRLGSLAGEAAAALSWQGVAGRMLELLVPTAVQR